MARLRRRFSSSLGRDDGGTPAPARIESPRLDPRLIERTLATAPDDWTPETTLRIRLFILDRDQLLRMARPGEL